MVGRTLVLLSVLTLSAFQPVAARSSQTISAERETLREEWHRCVREAFAARSSADTKVSAERAALKSCKAFEDAYVAAELAARQEQPEQPSLTGRARAWAASAASRVVDPVTSWVGSLMP